jgi:hypothetical protein
MDTHFDSNFKHRQVKNVLQLPLSYINSLPPQSKTFDKPQVTITLKH